MNDQFGRKNVNYKLLYDFFQIYFVVPEQSATENLFSRYVYVGMFCRGRFILVESVEIKSWIFVKLARTDVVIYHHLKSHRTR